MHLSLLANPSHLEAVDPVLLGKVRTEKSKMRERGRERKMIEEESELKGDTENLTVFFEKPKQNLSQVRAKQYYSDDHDRSKSMGVLLHGDGKSVSVLFREKEEDDETAGSAPKKGETKLTTFLFPRSLSPSQTT